MEERPRWSSQVKISISLLMLALGVYFLYRFRVIFTPIIVAIILAYVLTPVVNFFQKYISLKRTLSTVLTYLLLLIIVIVLPLIIFPTFASQVKGLNLDFQRMLLEVEELLGKEYIIAGWTLNLDVIFNELSGLIQSGLEPVFGQTLNFLVGAFSSLVWLVFIAVVSFYLVKDGPALREWMEDLVPSDYRDDYIRIRGDISRIWGAFFRGQLVLATVVAVLFTIIGFILGLPFALAMGVMAGLLEFLPSIGHAIWLITASLLAFFAGSTWMPVPNWVFMLIIVSLHIIFQQFDLNYLIPRIIGRSVHLPPLVVILGIVSGAMLAGVLGVLIAAPTIASARVIGRYIYACLFDMDPFPKSVAPPLPPPNPRWWEKLYKRKKKRIKSDD